MESKIICNNVPAKECYNSFYRWLIRYSRLEFDDQATRGCLWQSSAALALLAYEVFQTMKISKSIKRCLRCFFSIWRTPKSRRIIATSKRHLRSTFMFVVITVITIFPEGNVKIKLNFLFCDLRPSLICILRFAYVVFRIRAYCRSLFGW